MTCKHNWNFVDGLTKRIRCIKCAAMEFVNPQDKYVVEGYSFHDPRPNSIIFYNGGNPSEDNEVMRLSAEGVKVNPKFTVDEATGYVIKALDSYLKAMAQKEYERGVIDGKAQPELMERFSLLLWDYQELERAFEKITGGKWIRKGETK